MDKEIMENVKNMNKLIPLVIKTADKYMDEIGDNADEKELLSVMGSQATYLYNVSVCVLNNADVEPIDAIKLEALKEKTSNIVKCCAKLLGLNTDDLYNGDDEEEEEEDEIEIDDDAIDSFAKMCKLNKTETAVLRKIVRGRGNPTDMTEKDKEVALKMESKINKATEKL